MTAMNIFVLRSDLADMRHRLAICPLLLEAEAMGFEFDIKLPKESNAINQEQQQESSQQEHQDGSKRGQTSEAGGSHCPFNGRSRKEQAKAQEVTSETDHEICLYSPTYAKVAGIDYQGFCVLDKGHVEDHSLFWSNRKY